MLDPDNNAIWEAIIHTNNIKRLTCKRCNHQWNYKGKDKYRASCPRCRTSVLLKKEKEERR